MVTFLVIRLLVSTADEFCWYKLYEVDFYFLFLIKNFKLIRYYYCQAIVEQSKDIVLPVPVGD